MERSVCIPLVKKREGGRYLVAVGFGEEVWVWPPAVVGPWVILHVSEHPALKGAVTLAAVSWEEDILRVTHVAQGPNGELSDVKLQEAWAPWVEPRPDLAQAAREWLTRSDDPLRDAALKVLRDDATELLRLMPPLVGPGFVRPLAPWVEPGLVQPDGSTQDLPSLPIEATEPRRYGLVWGDGPVLVIGWGEGDFAVIQKIGDQVQRLVWWRGKLRCEPDDSSEARWRFIMTMKPAGASYPLSTGVITGDPRPQIAIDSSLALGLCTFRGLLPRYGVGCYDEPRHNSFPPATLFLVEAVLLWGKVEQAAKILAAYVLRYVREDGSIDYYGPSLSEYGQLLDLAARIIMTDCGKTFVHDVGQLLVPMARRCAKLLDQARNTGEVVRGLPEADYHDFGDEEAARRPYASGQLWLARGVRSFVRAMESLAGPRHAPADDCLSPTSWQKETTRELVQAAVSAVADTGFVPAIAGSSEVFERMTAGREAAYTNYRFWPEMLSSRLMPAHEADCVLRWRREHGGELMGMTRFMDWLDDWPVWNHAQGLLDRGDGDTFTMLLWAHLLHHQMPGWWASYEQVDIEPDNHGWRQQRNGQVVPCQVTTALMLRIGLLWEDTDGTEIWVLPAGELLLRTLGGRVRLPVVPVAGGLAQLVIRMDDGGIGGVLWYWNRNRERYPAIMLPPGARTKAAWLERVEAHGESVICADDPWQEPAVGARAIKVAHACEGRRVTIGSRPEAGMRLRLDFAGA
jgi:hypothetical protein